MKKKPVSRSAFFNIRLVFGVVTLCTVCCLALLANGNGGHHLGNGSGAAGSVSQTRVTARAFMRVTPDGVVPDYKITSNGGSVAVRRSQSNQTRPLGNTLWMVDDQNAIADGVAIDANNVWGAWILNG